MVVITEFFFLFFHERKISLPSSADRRNLFRCPKTKFLKKIEFNFRAAPVQSSEANVLINEFRETKIVGKC